MFDGRTRCLQTLSLKKNFFLKSQQEVRLMIVRDESTLEQKLLKVRVINFNPQKFIGRQNLYRLKFIKLGYVQLFQSPKIPKTQRSYVRTIADNILDQLFAHTYPLELQFPKRNIFDHTIRNVEYGFRQNVTTSNDQPVIRCGNVDSQVDLDGTAFEN